MYNNIIMYLGLRNTWAPLITYLLEILSVFVARLISHNAKDACPRTTGHAVAECIADWKECSKYARTDATHQCSACPR